VPRPRSLDHAQLASAALDVIDRDGLSGLTMRAVAQQLRMSTMAVYRYVQDRHELEELVLEHVLAGVDTGPPPDSSWQHRLEIMVDRVRATLGAHPEVIPLTMTHRHRSPAVLRWSETVLGILADAGIHGRPRVIALRCLLSYAIGAIQLELLGPLAGAGTMTLTELAPADFPHLSQTARDAQHVDPDAEFREGLALVLAGLSQQPHATARCASSPPTDSR